MHGKVNICSGSSAKFVNVTCGAVFPDNPKQYDIFIEDSTITMNQIFFEGEASITNAGDISILISNKVEVPKANIHKGNKNINLTPVPTGNIKIFESEYLTVYAKYNFVKTVLQDGTMKNVRAHYYDGTTWIKFSDSIISNPNRVAFLTGGILTVLDITSGKPIWQISTGISTSYKTEKIAYNFLDGILAVIIDATTMKLFNADSGELLRTIDLAGTISTNPIYIPSTNKFYGARHMGAGIWHLISVDMSGNVELVNSISAATSFYAYWLMFDPYTRTFAATGNGLTYFFSLDDKSTPLTLRLEPVYDDAPIILPYEHFGSTTTLQTYSPSTGNWQYLLNTIVIGNYSGSSSGYSYMGAYTYSAKSKKIYMSVGNASSSTLRIYDPFTNTTTNSIANVVARHIEPINDGLILLTSGKFRKVDFDGLLMFEVTSTVTTDNSFIPIGIPGKVYPLMLV